MSLFGTFMSVYLETAGTVSSLKHVYKLIKTLIIKLSSVDIVL